MEINDLKGSTPRYLPVTVRGVHTTASISWERESTLAHCGIDITEEACLLLKTQHIKCKSRTTWHDSIIFKITFYEVFIVTINIFKSDYQIKIPPHLVSSWSRRQRGPQELRHGLPLHTVRSPRNLQFPAGFKCS